MRVATRIAKIALAALVVSTSVVGQAQTVEAADEAALAANPCVDTRGSAGREEVCRIVNQKRSKAGRRSLVLDAQLSKVAQAHADDMFNRDYFSHYSPEGHSMSYRLRKNRVSYGAAGENIALGQKSEVQVMRAWMNSTGHRRNILSGNYRKIGVGRTGNYWVQVFTD